jgi:hypothetical protein
MHWKFAAGFPWVGAGIYACIVLPTPCFAEAAYAFGQNPSNGSWAHGGAYNYSTAVEAENRALQSCAENGPNCSVVSTFNNQCFAVAVQDNGNGYSWKQFPTVAQAEREAINGCAAMGQSCTVRASFCDTVKEVVKTLICTQPVFAEEYKLRASIDGTPARTAYVTQAINYLRTKYCREIEGHLNSDQESHIGDNCFQSSGLFRGERVYWGQCSE